MSLKTRTRLIHAVVVNLFLCKRKLGAIQMIESLFTQTNMFFEIKGISCIKVSGEDVDTFLNGQITVDLDILLPQTFRHFCRLDHRGKIKFYGHIVRDFNYYLLLMNSQEEDLVLADMEKFIISEDVKLEVTTLKAYFCGIEGRLKNQYAGTFNFAPGFISFQDEKADAGSGEIESFINGELFASEKGLFPESIFAINSSHSGKGCFVGQEVVSKIEKGKGARYFPALLCLENWSDKRSILPFLGEKLFSGEDYFGRIISYEKLNGQKVIFAKVKKEFLLESKIIELSCQSNNLRCSITPLAKLISTIYGDLSEKLFYDGVDCQNTGLGDKAMLNFSLSLITNNKNMNAVEAIGVLFGREKKFDLAHKMMDYLLNLDPSNVMAHTNKSLFFMNTGDIEAAEHEKELALNLSLPSTKEKDEETKTKEQLAKIHGQIEMYSEVLEIDPEDSFARNKWLHLNYELGRYSQILEFLNLSNPDIDSVSEFVWRVKASQSLSLNIDYLNKLIDPMIKKALKLGDIESANFLKSL